jgi:deoxyribonuclease IV
MSEINPPPYDPQLRFGAHMPTAGGLQNALYAGKEAGCDVVQIFTKSPQQWKAKEITDEQVELFLKAQDETGVPCLSSHDTYLINPCAADEELLHKSREALADELCRSSRLKIPFVVMHQGSQGDCSEEEALARLIDSVRYALDHAPDDGSMLLLETVAGQGKSMGSMGHRFEQISEVLEAVDQDRRVGVCLDTCHIFAAGYDIRTPEAYAATMDQFDRLIGLSRIRLIHANDSKRELSSRVDRHAHIGEGHIGLEGFQLLLTDPRLSGIPTVLETPKEGGMDPTNLAALRQAAGSA